MISLFAAHSVHYFASGGRKQSTAAQQQQSFYRQEYKGMQAPSQGIERLIYD
jgi:hypothetical protein